MPRFPNDNWTRVELFLRAHDRLPDQDGDAITQATLDAFCKRYDAGEIQSPTVDLAALRECIRRGEVSLSPKE